MSILCPLHTNCAVQQNIAVVSRAGLFFQNIYNMFNTLLGARHSNQPTHRLIRIDRGRLVRVCARCLADKYLSTYHHTDVAAACLYAYIHMEIWARSPAVIYNRCNIIMISARIWISIHYPQRYKRALAFALSFSCFEIVCV